MTARLLLEVDGRPLPEDALASVDEVRVEEATHEADALTLVARVDPAPDGSWHSALDGLAAPRTPVAATVSHGSTTYRFEGRSTEALWDLDASGASTLTIKAIDRTVDLDAEEKVVAWPGVADSDIATAVLSSYGIAAEVTATPSGPDPDVHVVFQRGTDWAFLRGLAEKWGYVVRLEARLPGVVTGRFAPLDPLADPAAELSLGFGPDAPRVNVAADLLAGRRVTAVRVPALSDAGRTGRAEGRGEPQGATSLGGQVDVLLAPYDVPGEVEPQAAADALANRAAYAVTLTVELDTARVGVLLRATTTVLVRGLGDRLSGRYLVDTVRHAIGPDGHRQSVRLVRNALGVDGSEPFGSVGGQAGGLL